MITDSNELVSICKRQMNEMGYAPRYKERIFSKLDVLLSWVLKENLCDYSPGVGKRCIDTELGSGYQQRRLSYEESLLPIAINKINALQKTGSIVPIKEKKRHSFPEEYLSLVDSYRTMMQIERCNKRASVERKIPIIARFLRFISDNGIPLEDVKRKDILAFMALKDCSDRYRYDAGNIIRDFIGYISDIDYCSDEVLRQVPHFTYRYTRSLPTVYTHQEIRQLLSSFDRASGIGKRDYLVTLLAAVYGWRAADIANLEFSAIHWDENIIEFNQQKSGNHVCFPLLPEVGNAIIDYLRNGRPKTEQKCIIVSHVTSYKGAAMDVSNMHSIITIHMKKAGIKGWEKRRHGPHSLRHSIASNMLIDDVSLPIIQQVLGHKNPETTQIYLSMDIQSLRKCTSPVPGFKNHPIYGGAE